MTWDHVFPEAWYPATFPKDKEKWKVPCCTACNKSFSKVEEDLFLRLGLCLESNDLASKGIPDRVLRSLNPEFGKGEREKEYRKRKRNRVLRQIKVLDRAPTENIFPNFGPMPQTIYPEYAVVEIQKETLDEFAQKITKGTVYTLDKTLIDDSYKIDVYIIEDEKAADINALINQFGTVYDRRPGLLVERAIVENEKVAGLYRFEIWARFRMFVTVIQKNRLDALGIKY